MSRMPRPRLLAIGGILLLGAAFRLGLSEEAPEAAAADIALQPLTTGLGPITSIANAGDPRLFLTLQTGRIVIFNGGQVQPAPFLDLSPVISCCVERGLLGLAFHPQYAANRFFFVDYTNTAGNTVIARYQRSPASAGTAQPGSGVILLTIAQPFANHNGGRSPS